MLSPVRTKKSDKYCYYDNWKGDNYRKIDKGKKQRNDTKNEAKKINSDNCTYKEKDDIVQYFYRNIERLNNWIAP